jgi:hypothetical protein
MQSIAAKIGLVVNVDEDPSAPYRIMDAILAKFSCVIKTWDFYKPSYEVELFKIGPRGYNIHGVPSRMTATSSSHIMALAVIIAYVKLSKSAGRFI